MSTTHFPSLMRLQLPFWTQDELSRTRSGAQSSLTEFQFSLSFQSLNVVPTPSSVDQAMQDDWKHSTRLSLQTVQTRLPGPPLSYPHSTGCKLACSKPTNLNPRPQLELCPTGTIIPPSRFLSTAEYKGLDVFFSSRWHWKIFWTFLAGI